MFLSNINNFNCSSLTRVTITILAAHKTGEVPAKQRKANENICLIVGKTFSIVNSGRREMTERGRAELERGRVSWTRGWPFLVNRLVQRSLDCHQPWHCNPKRYCQVNDLN